MKMKSSSQITILVSIQIALILSSFLVLAYFETQKAHHGNLVNVSGKNRFLASEIKNEVTHNLFHGLDHKTSSGIISLEKNLLFLKTGGTNQGIELAPLSSRYLPEWDLLWNNHTSLKLALSTLSDDDDRHTTISKISKIESLSNDMIRDSDTLTNKIGKDLETLSTNLFILELLLASVNIAVHIFMILYIISIFKKDSKEKLRAERFNTIGEFASNIAHDIKNPLTVINNSLEILKTALKFSDEDITKRELSRISLSVKRIDHQVDDVLNYIKNVPMKMNSHSVLDILKNAKETAEIPKSIQITLPSNDVSIDCDETQIHVVFVNLLRNAAQSIVGSKSKTGTIAVRLTTPTLDTVKIDFENSGPLIDNKDLPHLFEPLFTTKMEGTGLGLASCKSIVTRHNGTISVTSDNVVKFTVILPKKHKNETV